MNQEHHKISRRTGVVGFYTLLSRILGLLRDAVLASVFGATRMADAFYVAFRIPNLLRRLVGEGALTVAFVPIYTEYLKKSRESGREATSVIFTFLSLFLVLLVILGIVFAPWLVRLIAWGFADTPEKFDLTVYLTRLMFPYILLISLVALAMGILNSLKRFAAPAASPILLNVGIIFGALVLRHFFEIPTVGVALGVVLGGLLQLVLQIPTLLKEGMLPRLNFQLRHPALKGLLLLMVPSAFGAAVYQINVFIVTLLASFLPEGSVSYLWYADRVAEVPLGIFGIAVATATLPTLSDHAADRDIEKFKEILNFSLRLNFLIMIPAAVGLFILSEPIVTILFERGEFDRATSVATAGALAFFAFKLPFVSGVRNIVPGFFALKDAKTPVAISTVVVVVNGGLAFLLMGPMLHLGLAAALAISSAVNFFLLVWFLRRKIGRLGARKIAVSLAKTSLASGLMATALLLALQHLNLDATASFMTRMAVLFLLIAAAVLIFLGVTRLINRGEYDALRGLLRRRPQSTLQMTQDDEPRQGR